jgi:uncharacterized protein (DUF2345 family)
LAIIPSKESYSIRSGQKRTTPPRPKKTRFEFLAKEKKINIETEHDLRISANKKLSNEAEEGEIKITKGLSIEADKISMKSQSKDIEATAKQKMTIEGTSVKLN